MSAVWKDQGKPTPALEELIRRARAGDSWQSIAGHFYPGTGEGRGRSVEKAFDRYCTPADREARRAALKARKFNKTRPYRKHRSPSSAVPIERVDPWAGMGECFA